MSLTQNVTVRAASTNFSSGILPMDGRPSGAVLWQGTTQTGHLLNTNALQTYEVKLPVSIGTVFPASSIEITLDTGYTIVGVVVEVIYRDVGNTGISFSIEPWSTGQRNGRVEIRGFLERTNIRYGNCMDNLETEPFGFTEVRTPIDGRTMLNRDYNSFRGNSQSIVLWVTPQIMWHGRFDDFQVNPTWAVQGLRVIDYLPPSGRGSTWWGGRLHAGRPLVFTTVVSLHNFVTGLLVSGTKNVNSGDMMRSFIDDNGTLQNNSTVISRSTVMSMQRNNVSRNEHAGGNVGLETATHIQLYTLDDIIAAYLVPHVFATTATIVTQDNTIQMANPTQPTAYQKLRNFPYEYYEIATSEGATTDVSTTDVVTPAGQIQSSFEFVGGDAPACYLRFARAGAWGNTSTETLLIETFSQVSMVLDASGSIQKQLQILQAHQVRQASQRTWRSVAMIGLGVVATAALAVATGGISLKAKAAAVAIGGASGIGGALSNFFGQRREIPENIQQQSVGDFQGSQRVMSGGSASFMNPNMISTWQKGLDDAGRDKMEYNLMWLGESVNIYVDFILNERIVLVGTSNNRVIARLDGRTYFKFSAIEVRGVPIRFAEQIESYFLQGIIIDGWV